MKKKLSTKERILLAARKAFAEKGHDGVSMSEIASIAGVKKALIYYYFPSKEDLYYDVWRYSLDELEEHLFKEVDTESVYLKKIKRLLKAYVDFVTNKRDTIKIIQREKGNLAREDLEMWKKARERYNELRSKISRLIESGKNSKEILEIVDPEVAAELILNGLNITDDPDKLDRIREIIWRGLSSTIEGAGN
ncbi:TetR family transcriptional regulator [Kosmotoga arenicorallina S304]|uniref:TetR family transcriptional regulator n=1 Tax=Kosmotoga arenicorallina S304 TaxID=1453497 RepID=A0A176K0K2_9BACT|nr:TetR/AcrR family transcriptional regulator [Kosmotoga arenicorallina]OAA30149.1 TetR family transcriptional regulator [Kosmotoga arenicorallina S304]